MQCSSTEASIGSVHDGHCKTRTCDQLSVVFSRPGFCCHLLLCSASPTMFYSMILLVMHKILYYTTNFRYILHDRRSAEIAPLNSTAGTNECINALRMYFGVAHRFRSHDRWLTRLRVPGSGHLE